MFQKGVFIVMQQNNQFFNNPENLIIFNKDACSA